MPGPVEFQSLITVGLNKYLQVNAGQLIILLGLDYELYDANVFK